MVVIKNLILKDEKCESSVKLLKKIEIKINIRNKKSEAAS